jgi:hypothetical protein
MPLRPSHTISVPRCGEPSTNGRGRTWPSGESRPNRRRSGRSSPWRTGWSSGATVVQRTVDQALGEVRRPVFIAPRVDIRLAPASGLWPAVPATSHEFVVTLRHHGSDTTSGTVTLEVPRGWPAPAARPFTCVGRQATRPCVSRCGRRQTRATNRSRSALSHVTLRGMSTASGTARVIYPHIRPRTARARFEREGYGRRHQASAPGRDCLRARRGGPDSGVAHRARREGHRHRGDSLVASALPRFRTVVIGPRAWETEPALSEHNDRLLDWVRSGGTLIVQYQQFQYLRGKFRALRAFPRGKTWRPGSGAGGGAARRRGRARRSRSSSPRIRFSAFPMSSRRRIGKDGYRNGDSIFRGHGDRNGRRCWRCRMPVSRRFAAPCW